MPSMIQSRRSVRGEVIMMAEQNADHHRILHPESSQHYADEPADRQRCQQDDLDSGHHRQRGIRCHVQQVNCPRAKKRPPNTHSPIFPPPPPLTISSASTNCAGASNTTTSNSKTNSDSTTSKDAVGEDSTTTEHFASLPIVSSPWNERRFFPLVTTPSSKPQTRANASRVVPHAIGQRRNPCSFRSVHKTIVAAIYATIGYRPGVQEIPLLM